tara:strand:+ start:382 stop:513 length:132 start_codon:yes stop_codon:yes gene_type:complete
MFCGDSLRKQERHVQFPQLSVTLGGLAEVAEDGQGALLVVPLQ